MGSSVVDAALLGLAWATGTLVSIAFLPGHLLNASVFILFDPGSYLYAVDRAAAGDALYRDLAWQYGPLGLAYFRAFAAVGGNTPMTYLLAASSACGLAWVLLALLWIREVGRWRGLVAAIVLLLPALWLSNSILSCPHVAIEAVLLALGAWVLNLGRGRGWQPWAAGFIAGLLQWVRFGPHAVFIAVCLGLWALEPAKPRAGGESKLHDWCTKSAQMAMAYALTIAPLVIWFFRALRATGAWEMLWPQYMTEHYRHMASSRIPFPATLDEVGRLWLPFGVSMAMLLMACLRPDRRDASSLALLLLPAFFVLGCALIYRTEYSVRDTAWMAVVAWPLWWRKCWKPWRILATALTLVLAVANVRAIQEMWSSEKAWHMRPFTLPNRQRLWFTDSQLRSFSVLSAALGETHGPNGGRRPKVAVFIYGGGIHHFFGVGHVGRHWWYLPDFVRPWEEEEVAGQIVRHDLFIFVDKASPNLPQGVLESGVAALWLPLPASVRDRLVPHLGPPIPIQDLGFVVSRVPALR